MHQASWFTMTAGDSKVLVVTVKDGDGVVVDLTGATIDWALAASVSGPPLVEKSTGGNGITVDAPLTGVFEVELDPADTATLAAGPYYHEAQLSDLSGGVSTVIRGRVTIEAGLIT